MRGRQLLGPAVPWVLSAVGGDEAKAGRVLCTLLSQQVRELSASMCTLWNEGKVKSTLGLVTVSS